MKNKVLQEDVNNALTSKLEEGKVSEQCTEYKDTLQGNFWHPP